MASRRRRLRSPASRPEDGNRNLKHRQITDLRRNYRSAPDRYPGGTQYPGRSKILLTISAGSAPAAPRMKVAPCGRSFTKPLWMTCVARVQRRGWSLHEIAEHGAIAGVFALLNLDPNHPRRAAIGQVNRGGTNLRRFRWYRRLPHRRWRHKVLDTACPDLIAVSRPG